MNLLIGFGTDDGKHLSDGHAGDAKYIHVFRFTESGEEFVEARQNIDLDANPPLKPGTPEMAKARGRIFKHLDVLAGRKFGPGLPNLLKKFVCVIIRVDRIADAIQMIHENPDKIQAEVDKGENRKHLVLEP